MDSWADGTEPETRWEGVGEGVWVWARVVPSVIRDMVVGAVDTDALEGKGPQRRSQRRLGRQLEEVAKAVGGGYCRLQMPLRLALGVRGTVAGHRLAPWSGGRGAPPPPLPMHPWPWKADESLWLS